MEDKKLLDYPFDLYQRSRDIGEIVTLISRETGKARLKILDVGGYRVDAEDRNDLLLREFLPQHDITALDLMDSDINGYVRGDGTCLPFKDNVFDVVVSSDVFEHVPEHLREVFTENLVRVSAGFVILGAPFFTEKNALAENILFEYVKKVLHADQEQLKEHIENRLPDQERLEALLKSRGLDYTVLSSGNLENWLTMMMVKHYLMSIPGTEEMHVMLDRFYNMSSYQSDHVGEGYRKIFVIATGGELADAHRAIPERVADYFKNFAQAAQQKSGFLQGDDPGRFRMLLSLEELRTRRMFEEKDLIIKHQAEQIAALNNLRSTALCKMIRKGKSVFKPVMGFARIFLLKVRRAWELTTYKKDPALTDAAIAEMKQEINTFDYLPKISVVMPVYNIQRQWLDRAVQSVLDQVYENWELCIADDASPSPHIREMLKEFEKRDNRIRVVYLKKNLGMSGSSNKALAIAEGDYAALLDHDDELSRNSLFEVVKLLNRHPDARLIYSDEDKLTMTGQRLRPVRKGPWDPDLFLTYNYICHLVVCHRELMLQAGGFRKGFEGSQDYDMLLRVTELTDKIYHIPRILYHWRMIPGSAAAVVDAKSESFHRAKQALRDAVKRRGLNASVGDGDTIGKFKVEINKDKT